jgi:OOP family OmpA-OmpF porin
MANSNADFATINESVKSLSSGLTLASNDVGRPLIKPYTWQFTNMDGKSPTLAGFIPDADLGKANVEQIETRLGRSISLENALEMGDGAPANFDAATSVAIQTASRLFNGKAEISDTKLMVTGEALSEAAATEIRAAVENGLPPGFSGEHAITVRQISSVTVVERDSCQQELTGIMEGNSIRFETAKSIIREDSFGLLDRLAFAIKRCPTSVIVIEGHTDSDGSEEYNQTLSEERANAVRTYLVKDGIFVGRLKAIGYGEKNPVAENETPEGKARNRRIDFTVAR